MERYPLPDGRTLAMHRAGDGERVAVHCHGSHHSGVEVDLLAPEELEGWTVLCPDRPGHGASDPAPGQSLLEWARDAWVVLRRLGVERPVVTGWSAGGPHALALAATGDVAGVGVLSCVAPLHRPGGTRGMRPVSRLGVRLVHGAPRLARPVGRLYTPLFRHGARPLLALNKWTQPPADRRSITGRREAAALAASRDAYRQGSRGAVDDAHRYLGAWGFDAADVHAPATFWVGDRDKVTPPGMSRYLARRMADATVRVLPGAGHLLPYGHLGDLLEAVAPWADGTGRADGVDGARVAGAKGWGKSRGRKRVRA